jgi:class 3 adenylate cyclase
LAVLFTDMVGSTAQRARLGDAAGDELRREHDAIVAGALRLHGGELVKGTGDGSMCWFVSTVDALAAAMAIQQAVERRNRRAPEPLALRAGISAGELVFDDGDLHGLAANEAARICALAEPGEVLVSDQVRVLAASRAECEWVERGSHALKGLPEPVQVWGVRWSPAPDPGWAPLPSLLVSEEAMAFSGRHREFGVMLEAWEQAADGARRAVLVSGEPGIGKTRLAAEVAAVAHAQGAVVLYGRCDDELEVPFQPFREALSWYLDHTAEVSLGRWPGDLTRLSERVVDVVLDVPDPLDADAEIAQYRLCDAVASWLLALAADRPVVAVLDDLQWATKPTLLMLRHLLRGAQQARLLVVVTYRDTDLDYEHPLRGMLVDFRKLGGVERVVLSGLDESGVVELLERVGQQDADEELVGFANALVAHTEGNPFFIGEVLRHLSETGVLVRRDGRWESTRAIEDVGIPEGVKEVLGQRMELLGEPATSVVQVAAIIGRDFELATVAAGSGEHEDAVLDALGRTLMLRLVEETAPDRYRFSHALVRAALVDQVPMSRRVRVHRRVAEFLEQVLPTEMSALAHHWLEATNSGDPAHTIDAVFNAAEQATERGGFDEAATLLGRAEARVGDVTIDATLRRELRLRLGESEKNAGRPSYRDTLRAVALAAAEVGDTSRLVRAVLARSRGSGSNAVRTDDEQLALHEAALNAVGPAPTSERAYLLASLAIELGGEVNEGARCRKLIEEAFDIARAVADPALRVDVDRAGIFACWGDREIRRVLVADLDLVTDRLDPAREFLVAQTRLRVAVSQGELNEARHQLLVEDEILGHTPYALGTWWNQLSHASVAFIEGRLDDADRWNDQALAHATDSGQPDALVYWAGVGSGIIRDQGRHEDRIELGYRLLASSDVVAPGSVNERLGRAMLGVLLADAGRQQEAQAFLDAEVEVGFLPTRTGGVDDFLSYLYLWAEIAASLGDRRAAAMLFDRMLPAAGAFVTTVTLFYGALDRSLGRLATVLGRLDDAERYLANAEAMHERAGAPLFLARTWADQAELHVTHEGSTDIARAQHLVNRATTTAHEHGAPGIERYALRVLERARS